MKILPGSFYNYIRIARFDHWIKQLFVIPGIIFAVFICDFKVLPGDNEYDGILLRFILSFVSTCFIASANYIINEWLDAEFDKYHPTKKNRPVVSAALNLKYIIILYIIFSLFGLALSWMISRVVFFAELLLWIMGIIYNVRPVRSKEIPYIDVLSESLNNAIRLLIGWFIVTIDYLPPVSIIFGYWMGGAFLMAAKRFSEYRMIGDKKQAGLYRKSFLYYSEKSLLLSSFFYAMLSVFFCGIFMIKYRIELIVAIPFLCGLFCIYLNICYKPDSSAQKPEKLFKEKWLMIYVMFFVVLVSVLLYVRLPALAYFMQSFMDQPIRRGI